MNIVYASDDRFAEIMGISIFSLLSTNQDIQDINIYIVDNNISSQNKKKIEAVFEMNKRENPIWINSVDINKEIGLDVYQDRGSLSQYSRLFISRLLPDTVDKVIYFDCDILVNECIECFWNMELDGYVVAALLDAFSPLYRVNLGMNKDKPMFNSGVMLIDLKKWRERQVETKLLNYISEHKGLIPQGDQGALNAVFNGAFKWLDPKYNMITVFFDFTYKNLMIFRKPPMFYEEKQIEQAKKAPAIIHFTTSYISERAWIKNSKHPYAKHWLKYKKDSPWRDVPIYNSKNSTVKKIIIKVFHTLPDQISSRVAGFAYAYVRPAIHYYKYKVR